MTTPLSFLVRLRLPPGQRRSRESLGLACAANGGIASSGVFERRDVLGSLASTIRGDGRGSDAFADVRCLVACQPLAPQVIAERMLDWFRTHMS